MEIPGTKLFYSQMEYKGYNIEFANLVYDNMLAEIDDNTVNSMHSSLGTVCGQSSL